MKYARKITLFALLSLTAIGSAFGYSWDFTNLTDDPLVIKVKLLAWDWEYYNIVMPGERTEFSWGLGNPRAGHCLEMILLTRYTGPIFKHPDGSIDYGRIDEYRDSEEGKAVLRRHPLREPLLEWVKRFDYEARRAQIYAAAEKLSGSLGTATGDVVAAATGVDISKTMEAIPGIVTSIMDLAEKGGCQSRHFDVIKVPTTDPQISTYKIFTLLE